jgi:hypothetical protein
MKELVPLGASNPRRDPRSQFGTAWVAAFLGVLLTIGVVFWAILAASA